MNNMHAGCRRVLLALLAAAVLCSALPVAGLAEAWTEPDCPADTGEFVCVVEEASEEIEDDGTLLARAALAEQLPEGATAPGDAAAETVAEEAEAELFQGEAADTLYRNGLCYDDVLGWRLYIDDAFAADYTGLWYDDGLGWWLVRNGGIAFDYTGLWYDAGVGWWLVRGGTIAFDYTGLWYDPAYGWWLIGNGGLATWYTGLWYDQNLGWWLVNNGAIAFDYTGLWYDQTFGWWLIQNGGIAFDYTGLWYEPAIGDWRLISGGGLAGWYTGMWYDAGLGWVLLRDGGIDYAYKGLWNDANIGQWFVSGGRIDYAFKGVWYDDAGNQCLVHNGQADPYYTGVAENGAAGTWLFVGGQIDYGFSGMFKDDDIGWVVVRNGAVLTDYTGIARNEWGAWYFRDGAMVENYTGPAQDGSDWIYMTKGEIDGNYTGLADMGTYLLYYRNGAADFAYTGIARNAAGTWFVRYGVVDTSYSGTYVEGGVTYDVTEGRAVAVSAENPMLGVFFNSREDTTDTLYLSFDGYLFYDIGAAYTNAYPKIEENNVATVSPSLNPGSPYSAWVVNTLHDPCIFYKDGVFWMMSGFAVGEEYFPMLGYSTDLVNWSFPSAGKGYTQHGMVPTLTPYDSNGNRTKASGYDAVAPDAFVDDDGTVWMTVALGYYADSHANRLSQYLIKATGLTAPADSAQLTTEQGKVLYSDYDVTYSGLTPINLPVDGTDHDWEYDYDGSLFKEDGKYYLVVQHSGEEVQLWSIDDLNNASDPAAWTLVNQKMYEGSEGPCIAKNNGKYYLYTDRFAYWGFDDEWGNTYGIFCNTAESLDVPFAEKARVKTVDREGNAIPARHGTVITLTDENAKSAAMIRWNALYQTTA